MATGSKLRAWMRKDRRQRQPQQWPARPVWGRRPARQPAPWWEEHPSTTLAFERWIGRRNCDGTCKGTYSCANLQRITALRRAYRARRS